MAHQLAWIRDRRRVVVVEKSRRAGIDLAEAFRCVDERFNGRNVDYWYASADESAAEEFMRYVAMFARDVYSTALDIVTETAREETESGRWVDVKIMSVTLPEVRGRRPRITAMTSNPKRFRSKGGDVCLSEFAFHENQRGMWKAAYPTTTWGGTMRVISTHHGEDSFFNQLVLMGKRARDPETYGAPRPNDYPLSLHTITIYDAIANGIVEKINSASGERLTRDRFIADMRAGCVTDEAWGEEFECRPSAEQASFLPYDLLRPMARGPQGEDPGDAAPTDSLGRFLADIAHRCAAWKLAEGGGGLYGGIDVGRVHDLYVFEALARVGGMIRTAGVLAFTGRTFDEMEGAIAAAMSLGTTGRGDSLKRVCIDRTGMGMQLAERMQRRFHHRVEPVTFTAPVKDELASLLRRHFEEKTTTIPDDPVYMADLNALRKSVTASGNVRYDSASTDKRGGLPDFAAARMLALHAAEIKRVARVAQFEGGAIC